MQSESYNDDDEDDDDDASGGGNAADAIIDDVALALLAFVKLKSSAATKLERRVVAFVVDTR